MTTSPPTSRDLIQLLHDEMRADIPTFKIMGKSLLTPPWVQKRIDKVAAVLDAAIDARIEAWLKAQVDARIEQLLNSELVGAA